MPLYNVYVFIPICIKIANVNAETQTQAIRRILEGEDGQRLLESAFNIIENTVEEEDQCGVMYLADIHYAEDPPTQFLVDEVGDEDHERSQWYDAEEKPFMPCA